MLKLKKYANGQFFDTINKKYIKVATLKEMIQKGEKIKVTLTKTGKDITNSIVERLSKKTDTPKSSKGKKEGKESTTQSKNTSFLNTEGLKKWVRRIIDKRITPALDSIKLPNKKDIKQLDDNIKALNKKIDKLEMLQKKEPKKAKTAKKTETTKTKKAETTAPKN